MILCISLLADNFSLSGFLPVSFPDKVSDTLELKIGSIPPKSPQRRKSLCLMMELEKPL